MRRHFFVPSRRIAISANFTGIPRKPAIDVDISEYRRGSSSASRENEISRKVGVPNASDLLMESSDGQTIFSNVKRNGSRAR